MYNSSEYRELVKRITALKKQFVSHNFKQLNNYSQADLDNARAFRLLAHAEIEAFIEERVSSKLTEKLTVWRSNQTLSYTLVSLIAFMKPDKTSLKTGDYLELEKAITECATLFFAGVTKNHGIKEKNLISMLPPIGIPMHTLDSTWVINIESFGERRGQVAHNSIKTQQQIDPQTEVNTVTDLILGIKSLDRKIKIL